MISVASQAKKPNLVRGETRNLVPLVSRFFRSNVSNLSGMVERFRQRNHLNRQDIDLNSLRQRVVLDILHKAPKKIDDEAIKQKIDDSLDQVKKSPETQTAAMKTFEEVHHVLPQDLAKVVDGAFEVLDLRDLAIDLCISLDEVFAALRFFERKMLKDQNLPLAQELKAIHPDLNDSDRETLTMEFAGLTRDQSAKLLGISNRSLTNRFLDIKKRAELPKEEFNAIRLRQALANVDPKDLVLDRLLGFVLDRSAFDIDTKDSYMKAVMSINLTDIKTTLESFIDDLSSTEQKRLNEYLQNHEIHVNGLQEERETRELRAIKVKLQERMRAYVLNKAPLNVDQKQWSLFLSSIARNALRLYFEGHSVDEVRKMTKGDFSDSTVYQWQTAFIKEFGIDLDTIRKHRFKKQLESNSKQNDFTYNQVIDLLKRKPCYIPPKETQEAKADYQERIVALFREKAQSYRSHEHRRYLDMWLQGYTTPQIAAEVGLTKQQMVSKISVIMRHIRKEFDKIAP